MTCPCQALPAKGDPNGHVTASAGTSGLGKAKRKRKHSLGKGNFCVFSRKSGKTFNCYRDEGTASRVAQRFGPRFGLRER